MVDFRLPIADCKCSPGIANEGRGSAPHSIPLISGYQMREQPLSTRLLETGSVICRAPNKLRANETLPTVWKTNANPGRVRLVLGLS